MTSGLQREGGVRLIGEAVCCAGLFVLVATPILSRLWPVVVLPGPISGFIEAFHGLTTTAPDQLLILLLLCAAGAMAAAWGGGTKGGTWTSAVAAIVLFLIGSALWSAVADSRNHLAEYRALVFFWGMATGLIAFRSRALQGRGFTLFFHLVWLNLTIASVAFALTGYAHQFQFAGHVRWSGVFVNPNAYGAFSLASCIICGRGLAQAVAAQTSPGKRSRLGLIYFGAMALVHTTGLVLSFSRSAWLGALVVVAVMAVRSRHRRRSLGSPGWAPGRRWLTVLALASLVLPSITLMGIRETGPLMARIASFASPSDLSISNRLANWADAIPMICARPFGYGWSGWYGQFEDKFVRSGQTTALAVTLNDHLSMFLVFGWIPGLLWCGALGLVLFNAGKTGEQFWLLLLAGLLPVSLANNVIFDFSLGGLWWCAFFSVLFGAIGQSSVLQPMQTQHAK